MEHPIDMTKLYLMRADMFKPLLGQECITSHGLGRVVRLSRTVYVKNHANNVVSGFDPHNVRLVPILGFKNMEY